LILEASMRTLRTLIISLLALTALLAAGSASPAYAQDPEPFRGLIGGTVFVDFDVDLQHDPGEPVFEGVAVELASGESSIVALTGPDGTYSADVEAGLWVVTIQPPAGYTLLSSGRQEVVVDPAGPAATVVNFALASSDATQAPPEGGEQDGTVFPEPTDEGEPLLPPSGAPLAPALIVPLALSGLFGLGVSLFLLGRRFNSRS
jgi:hypothetical protein